MYVIDYEYDGQRLSDYGFIVCSFDQSTSHEVADKGSVISFTKTPISGGKRYSLCGAQYEDCYTTTFHICKDPDFYDPDERYITRAEFQAIERWMNRRKFCKFVPIDSSDLDLDYIAFYASFNLAKIYVGGKICGIELEMETNSPFGFGEEVSYKFTFTSAKLSGSFLDTSDDVGFLYPKVTIVCNADGNLKLSSDLGRCESVIKNCTSGETITMSGDTQIITSSRADHNIANDFNYDFFRVGNTIDERENTVTVSIPCSVTIEYEPILKDTP